MVREPGGRGNGGGPPEPDARRRCLVHERFEPDATCRCLVHERFERYWTAAAPRTTLPGMGFAMANGRVGMTEEEYLAIERASLDKHEYANGEIFAMAGGTGEHSAIAANLIREIGNALFGKACRVYTSDMRIKIPATARYVYPDASVVCGRPVYSDDHRDTLMNPRVVVEVISESTEAYDRGDKFAQYQTIPSLMQYVIAAQNKPRIEVFTRQDKGGWLLQIYEPGMRAELSSIESAIEVDRVYAGVFDESED